MSLNETLRNLGLAKRKSPTFLGTFDIIDKDGAVILADSTDYEVWGWLRRERMI